jgi:hypothetical protein
MRAPGSCLAWPSSPLHELPRGDTRPALATLYHPRQDSYPSGREDYWVPVTMCWTVVKISMESSAWSGLSMISL